MTRTERPDAMTTSLPARPRAAFAMRPDLPAQLFSPDDLDALTSLTRLDPGLVLTDIADAPASLLAEVELLITGWGSTFLGAAELDRTPRLRAVVHAAGTVKKPPRRGDLGSGDPGHQRRGGERLPGGRVHPRNDPAVRQGRPRLPAAATRRPRPDAGAEAPAIGNYRRTVGIVGASRIGRRVIELLAPFDLDVLVYDPYLTEGDPVLHGARAAGLDELFAASSIVSIHAPLLPGTIGMVGARQLELLPAGATLLNTARAPIVDEPALIAAVRDRGLRAVLDVTDPEPLPDGHPLRDLPGVVLTPHIAGALGNELRRLGASARREVELFVAGEPAAFPLTREALAATA